MRTQLTDPPCSTRGWGWWPPALSSPSCLSAGAEPQPHLRWSDGRPSNDAGSDWTGPHRTARARLRGRARGRAPLPPPPHAQTRLAPGPAVRGLVRPRDFLSSLPRDLLSSLLTVHHRHGRFQNPNTVNGRKVKGSGRVTPAHVSSEDTARRPLAPVECLGRRLGQPRSGCRPVPQRPLGLGLTVALFVARL